MTSTAPRLCQVSSWGVSLVRVVKPGVVAAFISGVLPR